MLVGTIIITDCSSPPPVSKKILAQILHSAKFMPTLACSYFQVFVKRLHEKTRENFGTIIA